ncbi:MAG TPA: hypothetical protein VI894_02120 [Candidatus Nanoarchaeia archaeon]|nr:hypothetical protein [Candidatus Nanoarchaeia archaeon]
MVRAKPMEAMNANRLMSNSVNIFSITNTFFSLIVIYFIFLFSSQQAGRGWDFLAFISKWYLIIVVGLLGLFIMLMMVFALVSLAMWMGFLMQRR